MSLPRYFIYALLDPDTFEIRYIGQSSQGLSRLNFTLNKSSLKINSLKNDWINQLLSLGKIPLFKILEICKFSDLNEKEIYWISKNKNLLNVAKGGLGGNTGKAYKKWKPVIAKNIETGEIKRFDYVWQVEKYGFLPSKVSAVCLKKRKSHRGYFFAHEIKNLDVDKNITNPIFCTKKPIKVYDLNSGKELFFDSIKETAKSLNICIATISNSLRGKTKCRNYIFEYM